MWGEWGREEVESRAVQGVVMSSGVKGPIYRPVWRAEASGGGRPAVEFNSVGFEE
jgi:hypothetical protein